MQNKINHANRILKSIQCYKKNNTAFTSLFYTSELRSITSEMGFRLIAITKSGLIGSEWILIDN
jgi:hypothetical protein